LMGGFVGRGVIGPAGDMWSLGVMAYLLLTGRNPFEDPELCAAGLPQDPHNNPGRGHIIYAHIRTHTYQYVRTHTYAYIRTHHIRTHMYAYIRTKHIRTHTYVRTHTYTYVHVT
jgi:serine/threonine protein kinase